MKLNVSLQVNQGLSGTFNAIRSAIQTDVGGVNKLIDGINSLVGAIPGVSKIGHIDIPNLDALQNVQLPSDFTTALQNLNNSLPSIADLKNKIEDMYVAYMQLTALAYTHMSLASTPHLNYSRRISTRPSRASTLMSTRCPFRTRTR